MLLRVLLCVLVVFAAWTAWGAFRSPVQRSARAFPEPAQYDCGKVLVVYYSATGSTAEIAGRIAAMTGGDLLEIETQKPYPTGPLFYYKARVDLKSGQPVELKTAPPDLSTYDVVFVGAPVWWYAPAAPLLSFLAQSDFAGKPVIPFCTAGGNPGDFFARFKQDAQNANILEGLAINSVSKTDPAKLDEMISVWLNGVLKPL